MKIQLSPGQKLTVGFYIPADPKNNAGWRPSEDQPIDGEFTIEYRDDAIVVLADMPDDKNRGGNHCDESHKPGFPKNDPVIYYASHCCDDSDDDSEDEKEIE